MLRCCRFPKRDRLDPYSQHDRLVQVEQRTPANTRQRPMLRRLTTSPRLRQHPTWGRRAPQWLRHGIGSKDLKLTADVRKGLECCAYGNTWPFPPATHAPCAGRRRPPHGPMSGGAWHAPLRTFEKSQLICRHQAVSCCRLRRRHGRGHCRSHSSCCNVSLKYEKDVVVIAEAFGNVCTLSTLRLGRVE